MRGWMVFEWMVGCFDAGPGPKRVVGGIEPKQIIEKSEKNEGEIDSLN